MLSESLNSDIDLENQLDTGHDTNRMNKKRKVISRMFLS